jgi:putative membrane protein
MLHRLIAAAAGALLFAGTAFAADLNDAEIAHIAYTAGQIDIDAANLALSKSKNQEILDFAKNMLDDHTAVNDQALALLKKLNVTPEDNDTSKSLVTAATAEKAKLSALDGAAFDKAYIDNEVAYHKTVNAALESTLIPATQSTELKALLETGLKIFQGHEQHAEHVAMSFQ